VDADGVHIGQDDLPYEAARRIIGKNKIVGISAHSKTEALMAAETGADYIGVGALFATKTKTETNSVDIDELRRIREAVNIPIVAIGGINKNNILLLKDTGIDGIAVVSAIVAERDATAAAQELKLLFQREIV
jgi:thiamine-phosphate pyrophosphorylase